MLSQNYLSWILPLLDFPEDEILIHHTRVLNTTVRIKYWSQVRKRYKLPHRKLRQIIWKLKFLTQLYEAEVKAFDI